MSGPQSVASALTAPPSGSVHTPVAGAWTRSELRRAVIDLAAVRGWHVRPATADGVAGALPGVILAHRATVGSEVGWPDLTLIRRLDRRLVFAALTSDDATELSPRKRLVLDLLCAFQWSSDERRRAELALGHAVPSIEAFVWRPADMVTGTIDQVLR
jgi:hypothetical protein